MQRGKRAQLVVKFHFMLEGSKVEIKENMMGIMRFLKKTFEPFFP